MELNVKSGNGAKWENRKLKSEVNNFRELKMGNEQLGIEKKREIFSYKLFTYRSCLKIKETKSYKS